jgi:hypothetical protein
MADKKIGVGNVKKGSGKGKGKGKGKGSPSYSFFQPPKAEMKGGFTSLINVMDAMKASKMGGFEVHKQYRTKLHTGKLADLTTQRNTALSKASTAQRKGDKTAYSKFTALANSLATQVKTLQSQGWKGMSHADIKAASVKGAHGMEVPYERYDHGGNIDQLD